MDYTQHQQILLTLVKVIPLKDLTDSHLKNIVLYIERKSKDGLHIVYGCYGVDMLDIDFNEEVVYGENVFKRMNYEGYVNELKRRNLWTQSNSN